MVFGTFSCCAVYMLCFHNHSLFTYRIFDINCESKLNISRDFLYLDLFLENILRYFCTPKKYMSPLQLGGTQSKDGGRCVPSIIVWVTLSMIKTELIGVVIITVLCAPFFQIAHTVHFFLSLPRKKLSSPSVVSRSSKRVRATSPQM